VTDEDSHALVIGYGNPLRRDDGAGCAVADLVRGWACPGVRSLSVFQLSPELASELCSRHLVIFVDARTDTPSAGVRVDSVPPLDEGSFSLLHGITPRSLAGLSLAVYGRCPPCWMVSIPAVDFSLGEGLSEVAEVGVRDALAAIEGLIDTRSWPEPAGASPCPAVERTAPLPPTPIRGPRP
jgi:hydrogenase maturation protease